MRRALLLLLLIPFLLPAQQSERFFVMGSAGWGPETGTRGEGSVGVRITENVYSLTTMNAAGGVGAVVQDLLSKLATTRGVTLWGRAGAGATSTNLTDATNYGFTFGGGVMLSYDLANVSGRLRGLELVGSAKAMYVPYSSDGQTVNTIVRPQYFGGVKFNWD